MTALEQMAWAMDVCASPGKHLAAPQNDREDTKRAAPPQARSPTTNLYTAKTDGDKAETRVHARP